MSVKLVIVTTRPSADVPWFTDIEENALRIQQIQARLESSPGFVSLTTEDVTPLQRKKTIEFADDVALRTYVLQNEQDVQARSMYREEYLAKFGCTEDIYLA
jgi:hypothetical protein